MSLQFITDSEGKTTGVFIPIKEWNKIKDKYSEINNENVDIPQWQMNEVRERLEEYDNKPTIGLNFNQAMDDIESEL
jgi:hypothetical protein